MIFPQKLKKFLFYCITAGFGIALVNQINMYLAGQIPAIIFYPIINGAVNEILQISHNRQSMQETALADNRMILDFLLRRDDAGARYAMSIHMKHLMNSLHE